MKRKLGSFILLAICLCIFVGTLAIEASEPITVGVGQEYATLNEALDAAVDGQVIQIVGNVTEANPVEPIVIDKSVTIQGDGAAVYAITGFNRAFNPIQIIADDVVIEDFDISITGAATTCSPIEITGEDVTLRRSTITLAGGSSTKFSPILVGAYGLTMEDVTFPATVRSETLIHLQGNDATFRRVSITLGAMAGVTNTIGIFSDISPDNLVLEDCTFTGTAVGTKLVSLPSPAGLTLEGCSFTSAVNSGVVTGYGLGFTTPSDPDAVETLTASDCIFNLNGVGTGINLNGYNGIFERCEFNYSKGAGTGIISDSPSNADLTFTDCEFYMGKNEGERPAKAKGVVISNNNGGNILLSGCTLVASNMPDATAYSSASEAVIISSTDGILDSLTIENSDILLNYRSNKSIGVTAEVKKVTLTGSNFFANATEAKNIIISNTDELNIHDCTFDIGVANSVGITTDNVGKTTVTESTFDIRNKTAYGMLLTNADAGTSSVIIDKNTINLVGGFGFSFTNLDTLEVKNFTKISSSGTGAAGGGIVANNVNTIDVEDLSIDLAIASQIGITAENVKRMIATTIPVTAGASGTRGILATNVDEMIIKKGTFDVGHGAAYGLHLTDVKDLDLIENTYNLPLKTNGLLLTNADAGTSSVLVDKNIINISGGFGLSFTNVDKLEVKNFTEVNSSSYSAAGTGIAAYQVNSVDVENLTIDLAAMGQTGMLVDGSAFPVGQEGSLSIKDTNVTIRTLEPENPVAQQKNSKGISVDSVRDFTIDNLTGTLGEGLIASSYLGYFVNTHDVSVVNSKINASSSGSNGLNFLGSDTVDVWNCQFRSYAQPGPLLNFFNESNNITVSECEFSSESDVGSSSALLIFSSTSNTDVTECNFKVDTGATGAALSITSGAIGSENHKVYNNDFIIKGEATRGIVVGAEPHNNNVEIYENTLSLDGSTSAISIAYGKTNHVYKNIINATNAYYAIVSDGTNEGKEEFTLDIDADIYDVGGNIIEEYRNQIYENTIKGRYERAIYVSNNGDIIRDNDLSEVVFDPADEANTQMTVCYSKDVIITGNKFGKILGEDKYVIRISNATISELTGNKLLMDDGMSELIFVYGDTATLRSGEKHAESITDHDVTNTINGLTPVEVVYDDNLTDPTQIYQYILTFPQSSYTVEYYKESVTAANLIETVSGKVSFPYDHQLTEQNVIDDLGEGWINEKKPAGNYRNGAIQGDYPVISKDIANNVIVVLYAEVVGGGSGGDVGGGGGTTTATYTVRFDSQGGSDVASQKVGRNDRATKPDKPAKEGHIFEGWYTRDGVEFDFDTKITENITLYAHWTPVTEAPDAVLRVVGVDKNGDIIYEAVSNEIITNVVEKRAPTLLGYDLTDDIKKTIVIEDGENVLYFHYDKFSGIVLELRNHIRYILGYPQGDVRPDNNITRAEATIIFYRLTVADDKEDVIEGNFSDVADGAWYAQAVNYMAKHGIVVGYKDGTFKPDEAITRAEFAAIASRFDRLEETDVSAFRDVPSTHWAIQYINSAAIKGWAVGFPGDLFKPDDGISRVEVVTIINRMLIRKIELEDVPEWVTKYTDLAESYWGYCDIQEASNEHEYKRKENGSEIWLEKGM